MKNKQFKLYLAVLLSVVASMYSNVFAQTWTEPNVPTKGSTPVSGHLYRVKNVEADMCITGGQSFFSWATTAILTEDAPITFTMTFDEGKQGWTFMGYDGNWPNQYLFISGNNIEGYAMHVDNPSDPHRYYEIIKQDNGYYRIRCVASDDTYGKVINNWENRFWGWNTDPESTYPNAMYAAVNPNDGYACDWEFIDMSTYSIQKDFYNLIVEIEDNGYDIDYSVYRTAYNSGDYDRTKAAYDELKSLVTNARTYAVLAVGEDGVNPPSDKNPCNATSLIVNNDFSTGNINGWTCTFTSKINASITGYQDATYTNGNVTISKFIEAWSSTTYNPHYTWSTLGDGELSQTLENLPQGMYCFACDAISVSQYGNNPVTGVELFATGGELEVVQGIATENNQPKHFEIFYKHRG